MQQVADEIVPIGTKVRLSNGAEAMIEGHGTVIRNEEDSEAPDEQVTVYEIEVTKSHVGAGDVITLEGERQLLYRGAFEVPGEFVVSFKASFKSVVRADTEIEAQQALITAISGALTWDGDDEAPDELEQLEMRVL